MRQLTGALDQFQLRDIEMEFDEKWYSRLIKSLKLQSALPMDYALEGVT